MENITSRQVRDAVLTIDKYIQENLYSMHPRTPEKWFDTKMQIDKIVQRETGKSVYGQWEP